MQNLSKNVWFSLLNIVLTVIVNLVAIRLLLGTLGSIKFGVFSIITVLNSLSSLFSFGLNYTLLHYLPKQGKGPESDMDITVVLLLSFAISIVLSVFIFMAAPGIFSLIKAPIALEVETTRFIKLVALSVLFILPIQIVLAVFDALQKNYISNIFQFGFTFLYWGVLSVTTLYSSSLASMGVVLAVLYPCWFIVLLLFFRETWGRMNLTGLPLQYKRVFKKHISSGTKYFVTNIVGYLNEPISKLLITRFIGLEAVAFFDIAMRVKNQVWGLFNKLTYPFLPYFASHENKGEIKTFIVSLTAVIFVFASIISLYFFWAGDFIIYAWLKNDSPVLVNFVVVTVVAYLMFSAIVFPVYYYFIAENKANFLTMIQLAGSVVNVGLFFILKGSLHGYAIIISHALSLFVSMLLCFYLYYRYDGSVRRNDLKELAGSIKYVLPFVMVTLLTWLVNRYISDNNQVYSFAGASIVFMALVVLIIRSPGFTGRYPIVKTITGQKTLRVK